MNRKAFGFSLVIFLIAAGAFFAAYNYRLQEKSAPKEQGSDDSSEPAGSPSAIQTPITQISPQADDAAATGGVKISQEQFQALTEKALQTLPEKSETQALTEEQSHTTSARLLEKAQILIQIVDSVDANPDLANSAMDFYDKCAESSEIVTSIRARCLTHLRLLAKKKNQSVNLDQYPAEVRRLSDFLPR